ncbi:RNA_pol_Rpb2_6 domain-containing protein [Trichonephila inaurata madagascariensis]|uniref:RNA_pol_Rpb2_6 domain-containing protein n=1 Tax=Trichonephila inaurata madagascariensis TaxID=2747483 RepID=A0A8X7CIV7_9ARAC|nr:RNA_pol_Rpb2_6 domain-containing protein [Trichonephila inaurata madagascariensis]
MVRVFTYDALDRGKELSYYVADSPPKKRGDMIVVGNVVSESIEQVDYFFDHCAYRTDAAAYMAQVYQHNRFDIDSLVIKIVVSPGYLFTKLFVKYLYAPLRKGNWSLIKSKTALVVKSIETGCLLHVLSRKTVYFTEGKTAGKMTVTPHESNREIGSNGEVFVEKPFDVIKKSTCTQTFPLNPYLSYLIVCQMSNKVKHNSVPSFHDSYLGFLCILGCFETKNDGRTTMMVRNTVVFTCDALDPVFHDAQHALWTWLQLEPDSHIHPHCRS